MLSKLNKILFGLSIVISGVIISTIVFGAPSYKLERTIIPETDSTYDLGTSTRKWRNGYFGNLYGNGSNLTGIATSSGSSATTTINSVSGPTFNFATSSDTNIGLNIISTGAGTLTFQSIFSGTIDNSRIASSSYWTAKQDTLTAGVDYELPLTFNNGLTRTGNIVGNSGVLSLNSATGTITTVTSTATNFNILGNTIYFPTILDGINSSSTAKTNLGITNDLPWENSTSSQQTILGISDSAYRSSLGSLASTTGTNFTISGGTIIFPSFLDGFNSSSTAATKQNFANDLPYRIATSSQNVDLNLNDSAYRSGPYMNSSSPTFTNLTINGQNYSQPVYDGSDLLTIHFNANTPNVTASQNACSLGTNTGTLTTTNLKGIWHLEEGTASTTVDDSGNAVTGSLTSGSNWTAGGKYGSGVDFERDGSNIQRINLGNTATTDMSGINTFTIGAYIKAESNPANGDILHFGPYEVLFVNNAGTIQFGFWRADATLIFTSSATTISTGTWYFAVARYNGTALQIFINGVADGAPTAETQNVRAYGSDTGDSIGNVDAGGTRGFDGIIDEPFLIKSALTDAEILNLYQNRWWGRTYLSNKFSQGYYAFTGNSLSYSTTGNITKDKGTIEIMISPTWDGNDGVNHALFDMETASGVNQIQIIKTSGNNLNFNIGDSAGNVLTMGAAVNASNFSSSTNHYIKATWNSGVETFNLDGASFGASSGVGAGIINQLPATMYVGRDATSQTNEANAIIDEVRINGRDFTSNEMTQDYIAQSKATDPKQYICSY